MSTVPGAPAAPQDGPAAGGGAALHAAAAHQAPSSPLAPAQQPVSHPAPHPTRHPAAGSLRRRLLAASAAWIALALVAVGLLLVALFRHHVEAELADRAAGQLDALIAGLAVGGQPPAAGAGPAASAVEAGSVGRPAAAVAGPGGIQIRREPPEPAFRQPLSGAYWAVRQADGRLLRSRSWWDAQPDAAWWTPRAGLRGGGTAHWAAAGPAGQPLLVWARAVELARLDDPVLVAVALDTSRVAGMTRRFARTVAVALGALAVVLWAASWLQVRQGLAPLKRMQAGLQRLRAGQAARLDGPFPAELQPLIDDLHAVLADNDRLVAQAREQTGNLAHALKTPLSVVRNASRHWPGADGELVREQLALLQRQVELQLARARAAARAGSGPRQAGRRADAAQLVDGLLRTMQRLHAERRVQGACLAPTHLPAAAADPDLLQEVLGNLIDNAFKWARARVEVRLVGGQGLARLRIEVHDDGPGIPAGQRAQVLQRGVRLDERRPGHGLGLAIADELARALGGTLELQASPLGGLMAGLTLPAAPPAS